jgi:glycosyltransferase involved in cell wall biosynthesis
VPLVTLAMPFYRGKQYLRRALESVLDQRETNWKLIVFDDGGEATGGVRELVESYCDPRIEYRPPNGPAGMARNWNRCLDAAETDLVALPHADDELLPDYVGRMARLAMRHPDAAVYFCGASIIDAVGRPRFSVPDFAKRFLRPRGAVISLHGEPGLNALMHGDFIMCPTMCFRRSRLRDLRFDSRWRQVLDLDLLVRLLLSGETILGTHEVLYSYRRHDENATAKQTLSMLRFEEELALHREIAHEALHAGWRRAAATAQNAVIIKLNLLYSAVQELLRGQRQQALQKFRLLASLFGLCQR